MITRRLIPAFAGLGVFLGALVFFSGCDAVNSNDLSGVWTGTATFTSDSILADQNLHFKADYEATFTFRITDDGGLITGTVEGAFDGIRTTTEAGHDPRRITFDPSTPFSDELFGTFIKPVLEMDVPDGPYEDDLWTFNVAGNGAKLNRFLTHQHTVTLADSTDFTFDINSDAFFEMRYEGGS